MKNWPLRILSSILTFTAGTSAAFIGARYVQPAVIQPVCIAPTITLQLPPPLIAEAAQQTNKARADEVMKPHLVSISPYEIKRLVDENYQAGLRRQWYELPLGPIWEQLGIDSNTNNNDLPLEQCNGNCQANIAALELDGQPGLETMLILSSTDSCRFLIFKQIHAPGAPSKQQWELLGYIDAYAWYEYPEYRIMTAGTKRWLIVHEIYGHGSGFGSYIDSWYEVNEDGVANVLSYQSNLYVATPSEDIPNVRRKIRPVELEYQDGVATIVLRSSTSYEGFTKQYDLFPLWTNVRQASFIKGPGMQKFSFDSLHSEMVEKELDPNYGDGVSLTDEEFLKYNYSDLLKAAYGRDAKRKEWLRNYLGTCDDTVEKQSLQKALEGARP